MKSYLISKGICKALGYAEYCFIWAEPNNFCDDKIFSIQHQVFIDFSVALKVSIHTCKVRGHRTMSVISFNGIEKFGIWRFPRGELVWLSATR